MQSRWSDADAREFVLRYQDTCNADLALRVYSSRLIGADPSLVLHGGGNTSVKTLLRDDLGREVHVLCVKGSGWDLGDIEPAGLPAVRLQPLQALRKLPRLSDEAMVNAQRIRMLDASAPNPSVETLLHAFLPHKFIDHSHADAILSLVDQPDAAELCAEVFGPRFAIVPYIMPGFALAKLAAEVYERDPRVEGLLLLQHGLFTFGESANESYERHIAAVDAAERFCAGRSRSRAAGGAVPQPVASPLPYARFAPLLRGLLGDGVARRFVLCRRQSPAIERFFADPQLAALSQRGCATPDHVIRTKRFPLLLTLPAVASESQVRERIAAELARYRAEYAAYVERQMAHKAVKVTPLDADPRVFLVPGLGLITAGESAGAAGIAADIYEHTIAVIDGAERIHEYRALPEGDLFDMEYWSLEQAKLGKQKPRPLAGRVVYVTGAARGIGAATARAFAREGATLYLVDREAEALGAIARELRSAHEVLDLTDEAAVRGSLDRVVEHFGGLDGVVSNAGIAPQGPIELASTEHLQASFLINFFAHQWVASAAAAVLKAQGRGGFLLFNASKAAFNPGAGFGPYALPKAALIALVKQYALELGEHGIRSNAINADRIRSGLLTEADIEARASARGLTSDDYYRANLLRSEVTADHVAQGFVELALAERTTGSVLTVDGGNIAASPR
jgi:rhamnose utilization protein RhaD (predicted bifunctional aldolase and dehydrogenase)/NAD(P)-dependent dehydrogenase (short-subunit alcohol dehydrogenase family)